MADTALDSSPDVPLERRLDTVALRAHEVPVLVEARLNSFRLTGQLRRGSPVPAPSGASTGTTRTRTAVLPGRAETAMVCVDPAFMRTTRTRESRRGPCGPSCQGIDASLREVVAGPGDLLITGSERAVHGRRPFTARDDGTARRLRRVNVPADIRRSAGATPSTGAP
ncbi:hypothetical protein [Streptomyces sp. NPDC050416]|uniref:hypothetical protein n=1 Tax=Streptomyces sp. NPDC050416 TaxID=3365611 RepID=UPI0037A182CF